MADPSLDQPSVDLTGLQDGVLITASALDEELFSALSRRHHMHDCLVAFVTELDGRPACLI